jgi:hypothetical protein
LERMVSFRLDDTARARVAELADKANEGLLTEDERAEYAEFVEAADLIAIMQANARSLLSKRSA